jgi:hypothetical protein
VRPSGVGCTPKSPMSPLSKRPGPGKSSLDPSEKSPASIPPVAPRTDSVPPATEAIDSEWATEDSGLSSEAQIWDSLPCASPEAKKTPPESLEAREASPRSSPPPSEADASARPGTPGTSSRPSSDTPAAKPERAVLASRPPTGAQRKAKTGRIGAPADTDPRRRWKILLALIAGPAILVFGGWMLVHFGQLQPTKPPPIAPPTSIDRPAMVLSAVPVVPPVAPSHLAPMLPSVEPSTSQSWSAPRVQPNDTAPAPSVAPQAAASTASSATTGPGDLVSVQIRIRPEGVGVYRKGKKVGTSPFTLELPRGERRAFEVGHPGYVTRKLILDGTQPVIEFGLIRAPQ